MNTLTTLSLDYSHKLIVYGVIVSWLIAINKTLILSCLFACQYLKFVFLQVYNGSNEIQVSNIQYSYVKGDIVQIAIYVIQYMYAMDEHETIYKHIY